MKKAPPAKSFKIIMPCPPGYPKRRPAMSRNQCYPTKTCRNFPEGILDLGSVPEISGRNCHLTKVSRKFREAFVVLRRGAGMAGYGLFFEIKIMLLMAA
jgi:hypothetical protein